MKKVRIIGAGLIGTSIGLGLAKRGYKIAMVDSDSKRQRLAQDLIGPAAKAPHDLVIFALPSTYLETVIPGELELNPTATFMDIGSIKTKPMEYVDKFPAFSFHFCGTHPMAGREVGGPESARADLFEGRPWIYTPTDGTSEKAASEVVSLIEGLGATPIRMGVHEHDAAVALISHLPQLTASLLAGQLLGAPEDWLSLAGQGLKDTTRIAASDSRLWKEIIELNRDQILPLLKHLADDLNELVKNFADDVAVSNALEKGREGRSRIPGKHGGRSRDYSLLPIVIEDKPGQLALLFQECADADVNVEDLVIEHSPGQFTGLITLALSQVDSLKLTEHLRARGWKVHGF